MANISSQEAAAAVKIYRVALRDATERLKQHEDGEGAKVTELVGLKRARELLARMRDPQNLEEAQLMLRRAEENHPDNVGFISVAAAIVELLRSYAIRAASSKAVREVPVLAGKNCGCGRTLLQVNETAYCVRCGVYGPVMCEGAKGETSGRV